MRSGIIKQILAKTPPETKLFIQSYGDFIASVRKLPEEEKENKLTKFMQKWGKK